MKRLEWCGDSRKAFVGFPDAVHDKLGHALRQAQQGDWPSIAKHLSDVGDGVFELRVRYRRVAYRLACIAKLPDAVFVLHCFVKDSSVGIRTRDKEIQVVRRRMAELLRQLRVNDVNKKN